VFDLLSSFLETEDNSFKGELRSPFLAQPSAAAAAAAANCHHAGLSGLRRSQKLPNFSLLFKTQKRFDKPLSLCLCKNY
jgi:hypothetical protein